MTRQQWLALLLSVLTFCVGALIPKAPVYAVVTVGILAALAAAAILAGGRSRTHRISTLLYRMREGRTVLDNMLPAHATTKTYADVCRQWETETYMDIRQIDPALAESFRVGRPERHSDYRGGFDPEFDWMHFIDARLERLDEIIAKLRNAQRV